MSEGSALLNFEAGPCCGLSCFSPDSSSAMNFPMLATLFDLLAKELAMLATLNLRIIVLAELRTRCSLRDLPVMLGNGSTSRLQMSDISASSRALSALGGAMMGIRGFVSSKDCDRLMTAPEAVSELSRMTLVFFKMTWHNGDLGPTVVAR